MKIYYHSNLITSVKKKAGGLMKSQSVLLSTAYEEIGIVQMDLESSRINDAMWQVYRSPGSLRDFRMSFEF